MNAENSLTSGASQDSQLHGLA